MGQRRLLVILLVVATALVDLGIAGPFMASNDWPPTAFQRPLMGALVGLAIGQIGLISALVAWGAVRLPWGLASVVLAAMYLAVLFVAVEGSQARATVMTEGMVFLLAHAAVAFALTSITRAMKLRIATATRNGTLVAEPRRRRFQFTLGRMFAWITSTAVILGLLRYTIRFEAIPEHGAWVDLALLSIDYSVLAIGAAWTMLGMNRLAARVVLLGLVAAMTLYVELRLTELPHEIALPTTLAQIAWLLAATMVLRVAGYRLVRRGAISGAEVSPPMDGESG